LGSDFDGHFRRHRIAGLVVLNVHDLNDLGQTGCHRRSNHP
jgi:hypothetical protein